jgi:predicted  nucleic acid-binding Zn-ribbon protein
MVFGFGKKKNDESSGSQTQQEKEIFLQDILSFLNNLESPRLSRIIQEAKHIKEQVESNYHKIKATILEFEEDDLNLDDVDKNLKTVVKRGKDAVVSTVKKEASNKLSKIETYADVLTLNADISQTLKRMGDVLGVHTRAMHVFARKYAERLKEEIATLAENRNSLQNMINEHENFKMNSGEIVESIKKIDGLNCEITQKSKRLTEVINEMDETKKSITNLEQSILELRAKREYQEFLDIKKKINLLDDERNNIKSKIDAQFSKISRPLSKYSYVSSLEKPMKRLMEELIADPYLAISIQNKFVIIEILEAATKSVLAGNISVKDSDKSVQQIEETINRLDEFLSLKEAHSKKLYSLESDLRVFDVALLGSKEKNLERAKSNLVDLESYSKKIETEIEGNKNQINNIKSRLETSLNHLSNKRMIIKS